MLLKLTPFQYNELLIKGYSLDHIFLLKLINENTDISVLLTENAKLSALKQVLIRKALICEQEDKLTLIGHELLAFIDSRDNRRISKKKVEGNNDFDLWWKEYCGTDTFTYKGKSFSGCRSLRQNKEECKIKFDKILIEGEYSADVLIEALKFDIIQKKENSVKTNTNKLTYMQNSLTYLNQRSYEAYIELMKQDLPETNNSVTDI